MITKQSEGREGTDNAPRGDSSDQSAHRTTLSFCLLPPTRALARFLSLGFIHSLLAVATRRLPAFSPLDHVARGIPFLSVRSTAEMTSRECYIFFEHSHTQEVKVAGGGGRGESSARLLVTYSRIWGSPTPQTAWLAGPCECTVPGVYSVPSYLLLTQPNVCGSGTTLQTVRLALTLGTYLVR